MRVVCAIVSVALAAACTRGPDSVQPRYVSPSQYSSWTCEQLADERIRLTSEVEHLTGLQRENANADTAMVVGGIFLWPVLFGLAATNDRRDELGRVKGEYEAVDMAARMKACQRPAPPVVTVSQ